MSAFLRCMSWSRFLGTLVLLNRTAFIYFPRTRIVTFANLKSWLLEMASAFVHSQRTVLHTLIQSSWPRMKYHRGRSITHARWRHDVYLLVERLVGHAGLLARAHCSSIARPIYRLFLGRWLGCLITIFIDRIRIQAVIFRYKFPIALTSVGMILVMCAFGLLLHINN